MTYFDHNATAPMLEVARRAWLDATGNLEGNPSSPHRAGARAAAALEAARETLAHFLDCDPMEIVWTSGATESCNLALHHFAETLPPAAEIWVSAIEHPAVLAATRHYFPGRHRLIPVDGEGVADLDWLDEELEKQRPAMIAMMAANNETGVLQPWREVSARCRAREIPYFCDAAQWIGRLPAAGLGGCDFVAGCAHKFGGSGGIGFLKCAAPCRPLLLGGQQEAGQRAGTENVAAAVSLVAALEYRQKGMTRGALEVVEARRKAFENRLLDRIDGVEIVGRGAQRLWNTVSAMMPVGDCRRRAVVQLDKLGFAVSTGSACASGREVPSHVLAAIGYTAEQASRALRFSSGWETTEEEWSALLDGLAEVFLPTGD